MGSNQIIVVAGIGGIFDQDAVLLGNALAVMEAEKLGPVREKEE